jgi:hypothetical protein
MCWYCVLRWIWCLWCYSECISTPGELEKYARPSELFRQPCNNLVNIIRLVPRLFQQVRYSHDITILLQPCCANLVTFSLYHACINSHKLLTACNKLEQVCWYYQTCSKVVPTSPMQLWYRNNVTTLCHQPYKILVISWLYPTSFANLVTSLIMPSSSLQVNSLQQACWYYQTCCKVVPTSSIQSWYNNIVTTLCHQPYNIMIAGIPFVLAGQLKTNTPHCINFF